MSNNIFNSGDKKSEKFEEKFETHSKSLINVIERQKDLESSLDLASEKLELLDHNSIKNFKKISNDVKHIRDEMHDIKEDIQNLKDFNSKMQKQIKLMASSDEVTKLEKYIDLWDPMDFVTREEFDLYKQNFKKELQKIIEEFLHE